MIFYENSLEIFETDLVYFFEHFQMYFEIAQSCNMFLVIFFTLPFLQQFLTGIITIELHFLLLQLFDVTLNHMVNLFQIERTKYRRTIL